MKKMIKEIIKIYTKQGFVFENRKKHIVAIHKYTKKWLQLHEHQVITEHIKIFVKCLIMQWQLKGGRNENRKIFIR